MSSTVKAEGAKRDRDRPQPRTIGGVVQRLVLLGPAQAVAAVGALAEHRDDQAAPGWPAVQGRLLDPVADVPGVRGPV